MIADLRQGTQGKNSETDLRLFHDLQQASHRRASNLNQGIPGQTCRQWILVTQSADQGRYRTLMRMCAQSQRSRGAHFGGGVFEQREQVFGPRVRRGRQSTHGPPS